jgi:hypothetical protein
MKTLTLTAIRCFLMFTAAAAFCVARPASANLITNPGFESGDLTGWAVGGFGDIGVDSSNPHSGSYAAFFGGENPILTQILDTVPDTIYTVSFWLANSSVSESNSFSVIFAGETLLELSNSEPFGYTLFTFSGLSVRGRAEAIDFVGEAPEGFWYLDDVSVTASGFVPEPFSTLWLALPFAGIVAFRRFRAKSI